MMNILQIHTKIHSRYQVLDASGQLPFSIVFGLCRRSSADADPRPLLLETAGSALDVPYALTHGLLTLHEQDPEGARQWAAVDLSRVSKVAAKEAACLSLRSPVNRMEHWRDAFMVYQCYVDVNGELASILEPGKKYMIRLASEDLGVKWWAYGDREQFVDDDDGKPSHDLEAANLVNSKPTAGNATFTVVKSLPWPPRIETRMRLCASSPSSNFNSALANASAKLSNRPALEIFVTKHGPDPITMQTRGHQRFLIPWGLFQPEPDAIDDRVRIIDAAPHKPPTSSLQLVDSTTGQVVRGNERRATGIVPLTDSNADRRPRTENVLTLQSGVPVVRNVNIGPLVDGLEDGQYKIRMQSRGCRWWRGEIGEEDGEDGRIPARLGGTLIPPLMLESADEVEICVRNGKVGWNV